VCEPWVGVRVALPCRVAVKDGGASAAGLAHALAVKVDNGRAVCSVRVQKVQLDVGRGAVAQRAEHVRSRDGVHSVEVDGHRCALAARPPAAARTQAVRSVRTHRGESAAHTDSL
jgi:hypothetical protein